MLDKPIISVCMRCEPDRHGPEEGVHLSHGYCAKCISVVREELRQQLKDMNNNL